METLRTPVKHYSITIFGLIFACSGFYSIGSTITSAWRDHLAAASWRETDCTILRDQPGLGAWGKHSSPDYDNVIQYRYSVDGQQYVSTGMDFRSSYWGIHSSTDRDYVEFASHYHAGQVAPCYYDPEHPQRAVLTIGEPIQTYFATSILGIGFSVAGLGIAFFITPVAYRHQHSSAPPNRLRPTQTRVIEERAGSILRLTIPGRGTLRYAVLPAIILVIPVAVVLLVSNGNGVVFKYNYAVVGLAILVAAIAGYFIDRYVATALVLEADNAPNGLLTVTRQRNAGPQVQSISHRDIVDICVTIQEFGRGMIYSLDILPRIGGEWVLEGWGSSRAELDWIAALLRFHLRNK
jgi:uncharacterized integral membrane protein